MPTFQYQALDEDGLLHSGTVDTASETDARDHLSRAGMAPLSVIIGNNGKAGWRALLTPEPPPREITDFTLDLAMLLKSKVTLDEALTILKGMETRRWLVRLIGRMQLELAGGKNFSAVLAQHSQYFPTMYIKMVEAAEAAGRLQPALSSIAAERQRTERLRKRLISAMAYPGFLAVAAIGVLFFVLLYIIPLFEDAISGYRDRIAPSTLVVFQLSEVLRANISIVIGGIVLLLVAFIALKRLAGKKSVWLGLFATLPVTGRIVSYNLTLTFCRTLSMLLRNDVNISTALGLIRDIVAQPGIDKDFAVVIADVRGGKRLSEALARTTILPVHVVQLLRVGEGAGSIADSADRIAEFYEAKLDASLGQLTAVLGPALMMLVSLLVGWLIITVMSALMSINDLIA